MLPDVAALNALDEDEFVAALRPLFEGAPGFVRRLAQLRPCRSYDELLERAEKIALNMPEREQVELLDSHPRIGADPAAVSALSFREQGYDRDPATAELHERLRALNEAYERNFGFRFVVHVAGRPRAEIARLMEERQRADRDEEKRRALADVFAIAHDRVARLGVAEEAPR